MVNVLVLPMAGNIHKQYRRYIYIVTSLSVYHTEVDDCRSCVTCINYRAERQLNTASYLPFSGLSSIVPQTVTFRSTLNLVVDTD